MDDCGWSWTNGGKVAMGVFVIVMLDLGLTGALLVMGIGWMSAWIVRDGAIESRILICLAGLMGALPVMGDRLVVSTDGPGYCQGTMMPGGLIWLAGSTLAWLVMGKRLDVSMDGPRCCHAGCCRAAGA